MFSKIKHCFNWKKLPISTVGLADKITSIFLIAILVSSVGAAGSLYSTGIQSNKDLSYSSMSGLFPTFKEASAMPFKNDPDLKNNCNTPAKDKDGNDTSFNSTDVEKMFKKIDKDNFPEFAKGNKKLNFTKGHNNQEDSTTPHSPFGKLLQDKQEKAKGMGNSQKAKHDVSVKVNCHKILALEKFDNGNNTKFKIKTFTSVKIKPMADANLTAGDQGAWGDTMVKNLFTVNAPDLGMNLTEFKIGDVFASDNTSVYEVGDFIYTNATEVVSNAAGGTDSETFVGRTSSTSNEEYDGSDNLRLPILQNEDTAEFSNGILPIVKVGTNHIRLFANYTSLPLNVTVTTSDLDYNVSEVANLPLPPTLRYYDKNADGKFGVNETVYDDIDNSGTVDANDIRMANARFVGDFNSTLWFTDGFKVNFPNNSTLVGNYTDFITSCDDDSESTYNNTTDTCNYAMKYGTFLEDNLNNMTNGDVQLFQKGPDLNKPIMEFLTGEVFLDSNSNTQYDIGEYIYSNVTDITDSVNTNHIRQFANYSLVLDLGVNVESGDSDFNSTSSFGLFNDTTRYWDKDNSRNFTEEDIVYHDLEKINSFKADDGDIRLANARFVATGFYDGSTVHKKSSIIDLSSNGKGMGGKNEEMMIGMEERQYNITETLEIELANNSTNSTASTFDAVLSSLADPISISQLGLPDVDGDTIFAEDQVELRTVEKEILFGNTIGPHITFSFGINIESCFWILGCVTWFAIGVSITPFVITGFRLPARIKGYGIPDRGFAETPVSFTTNLEPFDGSYSTYFDICDDDANTLKTVGDFDGTPLDCEDFASFDLLAIPSVINELSSTAEKKFNDAAECDILDPPDCLDKAKIAFDTFLKIAKIMFDPLPPLSVQTLQERVDASGLPDEDADAISDSIQGQEIVLKAGVVIEVDLVLFNKDLGSTEFQIEIDILGLIEGFLLYNEIVKSSNPIIYNGPYAKKVDDTLLQGKKALDDTPLIKFKTDEKYVDKNGNGEFDFGESIYKSQDSIVGIGDMLLSGKFASNGDTLDSFVDKEKHTDENKNKIFDDDADGDLESIYLSIDSKVGNNKDNSKADFKAIWDLISDYEKMKGKGIVFTSFFTPYGFEGEDPRGFPYLEKGDVGIPVLANGSDDYNVLYLRGNCLAAIEEGQLLKTPAPAGPVPICTQLWQPGLVEAILGVQSTLGSLEINGIVSTEGDAKDITKSNAEVIGCDSFSDGPPPDGFPDEVDEDSKEISYCAYKSDDNTKGSVSSNVTKTYVLDNYDDDTDIATIKIDDLKYKLQLITIGDLLVNFEEPVKGFLPSDVREIKINLFTETIDFFDIPQHPGVSGFAAETKVFNYALDVSDLDGDDPINGTSGTKPVRALNFTNQDEPISFANVTYKNIGNSLDTIQNLTISFPALDHRNSNPNEDESWLSAPNQTELDTMNVPAFNGTGSPFGSGTDSFLLPIAIKPARHWTTTPSYADNGDLLVGLYEVAVFASSANATKRMMNPIDPSPSDILRINATNIIQVNVTQFGNPQLNFTENATETKPSKLTEYKANIANFGNLFDVINFTQTFENSNSAGCDLFEKGPDNPNCPFRAEFTALQNPWTNSTGLCDYYWNETLPCDDITMNTNQSTGQKPNYNRGGLGLNVTDSRNHNFTIQVPANWIGVDDTLYQLKGVVRSMEDKVETDTKFLNHTVIATKESSIRYIALEIDTMKGKVINANLTADIDKGSQTALTQILDLAIEAAQERALESVCDGNFRGANGGVMTAQHQIEGLIHAIEGMSPSNIRVEFAEELISNANATIVDIDATVANNKTSLVVPCLDNFDSTTSSAIARTLVEETLPSDDSATTPSDDSVTTPSDDSVTTPSDDSVTTPSDVDLEDNIKSSSSSSAETTELQLVSGVFSSSAMGLAETLTGEPSKTTPTIFETGKKIDFEFEFYENSGTGIEHFELVTKIPEHQTIYDSELRIEYNKDERPIIHNPEGLWSSASISVKGDGLNPKVKVSMVFDKPMETSDVILRLWDSNRNSVDIEFENVIKVIESPKSEIVLQPDLGIDPEPIFSWERFDEWAGYSESDLTDEEFLKHLEIGGDNIPSWVKQNNAKWVKQGLITQDELVIALENLKNRGII